MSEMLLVPGNRPNTPRAVDPDALGKIRNIVKSAHKWGGDGRRPKFRKIRRVLTSKHPEVIAKAFGGNPNAAAAWIKNNWYRMRGMAPPPTRGKHKDLAAELTAEWCLEAPDFDEMDADGEFEASLELFLALDEEIEADGDNRVWTPILRTGHWESSPIVGRHDEPWDCTLEDLQEIEQAFNEKAWEFVTVPASKTGGSNHIQDPVYANTGFVEALAIRPHPRRPGVHVLWGRIEFTEQEALSLVRNRTVRGVSVNVKFNVKHQETGKVYRKALAHVCLTNTPFANDLGAFQDELAATGDLAAARKKLGFTTYELDEDPTESELGLLAEIRADSGDRAYDEDLDYDRVRNEIQNYLEDYQVVDGEVQDAPKQDPNKPYVERDWNGRMCVRGLTPTQALVSSYGQGDASGWVVGYDVDASGEVSIDPTDEWKKVEKSWIELTRFFAPVEPPERKDPVPFDGIVLVDHDSLEGGAQMAGENENGELRMSREQLGELMAEAIRKDREERGPDPEIQATRDRIESLEAENHRLAVGQRVARLNDAKLPPAFIKKAKELMLSPVGRSNEEITLTREPAEDGGEPVEVKLTFLEAIEELAATVPASPDSEDPTKGLKQDGGPAGGEKDPEEIAAEIMKDLEEGEVALVDADLTL